MTRHTISLGVGPTCSPAAAARGRAVIVWLTKTYVTRVVALLYRVRELRHDRDEREERDPGRQHRQTELRVAVQLPRLGSDVDHALLSLRLRPGDDACVCVDLFATPTRLLDGVEAGSLPSAAAAAAARGSRSSVASIRIVSPSGRRFQTLCSALVIHSYGTAPPRARAEWAGAQQHQRPAKRASWRASWQLY